MKLPTASALPRVFACPQSHRLPQAAPPPTKAGELGTAIHLWLSDGVIPDDPAAQAACDAIAAALPNAEWRHEVTLAYDSATDTGRELGQHLGRDYSAAGATEWVGTADAIAMVAGAPTVLELKTGWRAVSSDSWQVRLLALAAARAVGTSGADVLLLSARTDGSHWVERKSFNALDLDDVVDGLERLQARLAQDSATMPGDHCRYCPAMASCPSMSGIMRGAAANETPAQLATPDVAAQAFDMLKALKAATARLEAELEAYALREPIKLASGDTWGFRETPKLEFLPGAAHELKAKYGTQAAKAITENISKTSILRALGKAEGTRAIETLKASGAAREKLVGGFGLLKEET